MSLMLDFKVIFSYKFVEISCLKHNIAPILFRNIITNFIFSHALSPTMNHAVIICICLRKLFLLQT